MSYLLRILIISVSFFVMAGCGSLNYSKYTDVSGYPNRYADFDYRYAWKTAATDQGLLIEGVLKNVRYAFIDSVLMTVNVLDKDGKIVAKASDFPRPQQNREGDVCFFSLLLRDVKLAPGETFQFQIHYTGNEGDHHGGGVDWYSSFKVDAMTGIVSHPSTKNPVEW
jgi:hypothetical protein